MVTAYKTFLLEPLSPLAIVLADEITRLWDAFWF